ncbi:MAG TPA: phosphoglycerate kinase [Candidatus Omnitrophica bacterium]|nr:phosphoglycerate kinase [Candidatus Omnitrophota bacterium]
MTRLTIKDLDLRGKRVLMRVDFNVPLTPDLKVSDDTRIKAALPTIKYALEQSAKVILMSHLGRPKGKVVEELRLTPVAKRLSELLGQEVKKVDDCVGEEVERAVSKLKEGEILLLENVRFHPEEEKNDPEFAKQLAKLGDVFINDAFGSCHRAHASVVGVPDYLPAAAGFLLMKEIEYFEKILHSPEKPFYAILGGAKVSDKIGVIENLLNLADKILIGGGMAYTFLKTQGIPIGSSKLEEDKIEIAGQLLANAQKRDKKIILPQDHIVVEKIDPEAQTEIVGLEIPEGKIAVDIGPKTVEIFKQELKDTKMIVWNGPLGIFEMDKFATGTRQVAEFVVQLPAIKVAGGGDTLACLEKFGLADKFDHVSTGGGASLEYLEGKTLPGIAALREK